MAAHRLQAAFSPGPSTPTAELSGFMPCPLVLLGVLSAPQQQFIQEIYRIARERTEAQLRPAFRLPEFSVN